VFCALAKKLKHKVPHPYSAAKENAASLTGIRDDDDLGFGNIACNVWA